MCGIFGLINGKKARTVNNSLCNVLADSLVANSLRGFDSTGLFQVDNKLTYIHKAAVSGTVFRADATTKRYLDDADRAIATVFHNRAATKGAVIEANAHPFEHVSEDNNYLIGVHNGTLNNWENLHSAKGYSVDSDWALGEICSLGLDGALPKIDGAYVFVWHEDKNPKAINFLRNYQRPMYVVYVKHVDRMLFASEYLMLQWLADRNNITLEDNVIELACGYHYQFSTDNPRDFTRRYVGNGVRNTNRTVAGTSTATNSSVLSAEDMYVNRIKAVIAITKAQLKAPAAVTTDLVVVKHPEPPVTEIQRTSYVSADEVRLAKAMEVHYNEASMKMYCYDETKRELYGVVKSGGSEHIAVIREVNKSTYDTWKVASSLGGTIVGARTCEDRGDGVREVELIISRSSVAALKEAEEAEQPSELELAIKNSIAVHEKAKENANQTVH